MRRLVIVLVIFLFSAQVAAADQTSHKVSPGGRFGAPVVKYTTIRDQGTVMFGGRGGWNVTPSLVIGGGLYATMSEVDAQEGAVPEIPGVLDVKLESFGFDVEYGVHPAAPTHLTLGTLLGSAAIRYVKDKTDEQQGETDFVFLLEPSVGVDQRVTDGLHLNLSLSFRLVSGVQQPGLKESDLNGAAVALAVKFGRF